MTIRYWGVRGTVAVPGFQTVRYGGNTSCVTVEWGDNVLVIDAGTGAIPLGRQLLGTKKRTFMLFSHLHLDHIRGFPLFAPLYNADSSLTLIGFERDGVDWFPTDMLDGKHFPTNVRNIPASIAKTPSSLMSSVLGVDAELTLLPINHPGGANAVRVRGGGRSFVHVADNELVPHTQSWHDVVEFSQNADVLSHDAQYTESEYVGKTGWGHSTWQRVCDVGREASVGQVVLFHHDPERSDDALDEIQEEAAEYSAPIPCSVAYEGLQLKLE